MTTTGFFTEGFFTYITPVRHASGLPVATVVSAEQYLQYARNDLTSADDRGLINGLGNEKRALHLLIDTILQNYGLLAQNRAANFPDKLSLV